MWGTFQGSELQLLRCATARVSASELTDSAEPHQLATASCSSPTPPSDIRERLGRELLVVPSPTEMKRQIFQTPEFQQGVVQGFSQLEWSDDQSDEKQSSGTFKPGTIENVQRWAAAYGRDASATEAYLANDAELKAAFEATGMPLDGMTPMDVLQTVEGATVKNRFVPPQIWMDEADRDDSSLAYVGTVLNCELLTAVDGSGDDACAAGGGGVTEWSEGASDTSTYPHFAVVNGGERTHRRFDVAGPSHFGPDSLATVRITHGDVGDTRYLLHVPSSWEGHETENIGYHDYTAWCKEQLLEGKSCAASSGIVLQANASGAVDDETFTWRLGDICDFSEDGTTASCPVGTVEGGTFKELGRQEISTWADGGHVTVTFKDLGGDSSAELNNCAACPGGGGQANQIKVTFIQGQ